MLVGTVFNVKTAYNTHAWMGCTHVHFKINGKELMHTHLARFDGLVHLVRVGRHRDEVPAAQQAVKAEHETHTNIHKWEEARGGRGSSGHKAC